MLWLGLHFPRLPLDALAAATPPERLLAVVAGERPRRLFALNAAAREARLRPGLAIGSAYAVAPALQVIERDPAAEADALTALANWAGQFTPTVVVQPPAGLLLEIGGCLRLFGGAPALMELARDGACALGHAVQAAMAPTPAAAALLAVHADGRRVDEIDRLEAALAPLPLSTLPLSDKVLRKLRAVGCRHIGEVLALPRAGLTRRHGKDCVDTLQRLLGTRPDPREPHQPPPRYRRRLELTAETASRQALLFGFARLLGEFSGYLRGRDVGVLRWQAVFEHAGEETRLSVGQAAPCRDADHLRGLLGERLEATRLPAPVRAIALAADDFAPWDAPQGGLLDEHGGHSLAWPQLLERLAARLGPQALCVPALRDEHRPERGYALVPAGGNDTPPGTAPAAARPLWLLPEPEPIDPHELILETGPERLESGWWDGADIGRDYHRALAPDGRRLWVFCKHESPPRWFLHGLFG